MVVGLLAAMAVAFGAIVIPAPDVPGVHVASRAAATYWPGTSIAKGSLTGYPYEWISGISCKYGASATNIGGSQVRVTAWYQDCRASYYKTICVRLWQENWGVNGNGIYLIGRYLVRAVCLPGHTGSTGAVVPPVNVAAATTTYAAEVLFFMGSTSVSRMGNTMAVTW